MANNLLSKETSPYLLQHKDNPVEWYSWNDESLKKELEEFACFDKFSILCLDLYNAGLINSVIPASSIAKLLLTPSLIKVVFPVPGGPFTAMAVPIASGLDIH